MTISSIARRLNFTAGVPPWLPPLILVTDETRLADPLPVLNSLPPGTGVLLRHYETPHRLELAQEIASICRRNRLLFLLAGDADLAFTVNADGLHLPDYMVRNPPLTARIWRRHPGKLVTAAAHSRFSLLKAGELGADAALLSPVFRPKAIRAEQHWVARDSPPGSGPVHCRFMPWVVYRQKMDPGSSAPAL